MARTLVPLLCLLTAACATPGPRTFTVSAKDLRDACYSLDKRSAVNTVVMRPVCTPQPSDKALAALCTANRQQASQLKAALDACFLVLDQADTAPPKQSFDASQFFRLLSEAVKTGLGAL